MKKILLAGSIALMATCGSAFAQSAGQTRNLSATGGQGGTSGAAQSGPNSAPQHEMRHLTTGMATHSRHISRRRVHTGGAIH